MFEPGDIVEYVGTGYWPQGGACPLSIGVPYTVVEFIAAGSLQPNGRIINSDSIDLKNPRAADHVFGNMAPYWSAKFFRLLKRRDPDLIRKLLSEPLPADLVAA